MLTVDQDKRFWDYRALFRNRSSCYRLACNVVFSVFGQWAGNGALTYYLVAVLETVGIKNSYTQANMSKCSLGHRVRSTT